ncbi:MAG TPA: hypothetical protein VFU15_10880 [Bacteroidia bacterium]|nr:hypothetical protein [Bacteroidia bacterium]
MRKLILTAAIFFSVFATSRAQNPTILTNVSPYSRYGIGDIQFNQGMFNAGMGGGGIGYRNDSLIPQYINLQNPASYTGHQIVAYEVSLLSNTVQLQNSTTTGTFNRTTLGNFSMAFPVTKWWGAGFGLTPYSNVGYNLSLSDNPANIGPVTYKYEGSGGVDQVFITNAFRPFAGAPRKFLLSDSYDKLKLANDTSAMQRKLKMRNALANISVGVTSSYLFGTLNYVRRDEFPDSLYNFNTKISKRTQFRDFYLNYGVQYTFRLPKSLNPLYHSLPDSVITGKKIFSNYFSYTLHGKSDTAKLFIRKPGIRVSVGFVFSLPTDINVSSDILAQTYKLYGTIEQFRDTVFNNTNIPSRIVIPAMYGAGFALKKDFRWVFQADYMTQLWSQSTIMGQDPGLKDSRRVTAGFQFQPKQAGRGNFLGTGQYRVGVRYYQTYLDLMDTRLTEMSANLSLAFQVPHNTHIGEPVSRLQVTFEYGMRGTTSNNLVQENFYRVTLGLTINDRWFNHYKYD